MASLRKPLEEYLLEKGYLNRDQLTEAKKVMEQSKTTDLGSVLVELGFVGEREVVEAMAQEQGLRFVDLDREMVDSSAINVVPERVARQHTVFPFKKEGMTLYLAISNKHNLQAVDDVQLVSGCRVVEALAVRGAIEDAIRKHYGSGETAGNGASAPMQSPAAAPEAVRGDISKAIAEAGASRDIAVEDDEAAAAQVAEQAPIIRLANALIQQAITDRASDIHVEPQQRGLRIRFRIDGVVHEAMTIPKNLQAPLISRYKIMAEMNIAERRLPHDGRIEVRHTGKEYDMRVSSIPTPWGEKIVMRILDESSILIGLENLGFTEENQTQVDELISQPNGMFLSTGPTGAGKTTTQYAVLHKLNSIERNIITIEDPIEFVYAPEKALINQRELGMDVIDFHVAMKHAVREDPDIMLVGEMRDRDTFETAIHAAETGHLVFGTIHASGAPGTIGRILDLFPQAMHSAIRASMGMNMRAICGQKLLKTIVDKPSRVPILEIMKLSAVVKKLVLKGEDEKLSSAIRIGKDDGMQLFNDSLYDFIQKEMIDRAAAFEISTNVEELKMMLKGIEVKAPAIL